MTTTGLSMAAAPTLRAAGSAAVLSLGGGENRLNSESVAAIHACLDEVEAGSYEALVTTAEGKIWCNGLDQQWRASHPDRAGVSIRDTERLSLGYSGSLSRRSRPCRATRSPVD